MASSNLRLWSSPVSNSMAKFPSHTHTHTHAHHPDILFPLQPGMKQHIVASPPVSGTCLSNTTSFTCLMSCSLCYNRYIHFSVLAPIAADRTHHHAPFVLSMCLPSELQCVFTAFRYCSWIADESLLGSYYLTAQKVHLPELCYWQSKALCALYGCVCAFLCVSLHCILKCACIFDLVCVLMFTVYVLHM